MMRFAIAAVAALMLASCGPGGEVVSTPAPPFVEVPVGEREIAQAFVVAGELTLLSKKARLSGHSCCRAGSASAERVAALLESSADILEAASAAQKLHQHALAGINLQSAYALLAEVRSIIAPTKSKGNQP